MHKIQKLIFFAAVLALLAVPAIAGPMYLYVDSAPNKNGDPDWNGWWSSAKADVVAGNFQNMRAGSYPGTLYADPLDMIVYSTGDLGKRLHWIYWIPEKSVAELTGNFDVRIVLDWDNVQYSLNWASYGWDLLTSDNNWIQPASWENYGEGTIGSFGNAWWAYDDLASPFDTKGNPYDETDAADIQALRADIFQYQNYIRGEIRLREAPTADWQTMALQVHTVPEPSTFLLLGLGIVGVACARFRRR